MAYPVEDAIRYLTGEWLVRRQIEDLSHQVTGHFHGTAEFRPTPDGSLAYRETGELEFGTHRGPAWRELRYLRRPDRPLRVEFDDGRFFHDLDLTSGHWTVRHPCRADEYQGAFQVDGPTQWWQDWLVHGPTKQQRLRTSFTRI